ncbi:MAG TPA: hypothetical protein VEG38_09865 [Acidimicrobiia bacterium]|nr:hypothetical protein [Acidimicrobiia bacterium]
MRVLVVVMLVGLALSVLSAGLTIWWTIKIGRRLTQRARRLVERASLTARAQLVPGAARQVASARLQLSIGVEQTRRALEDAARRNCPLGDLPSLFRRVERLAEAVDAELQMLVGDRDAIQRMRLAAVLARSDELTAMTTSIRRTLSGVRADMHADGFGLLRRDLDVELEALRAGAAVARQPGALSAR